MFQIEPKTKNSGIIMSKNIPPAEELRAEYLHKLWLKEITWRGAYFSKKIK